MSDLDREILAYERMREDIKRAHGAVWALVASETLVQTFSEFSDAARYAVTNCAGREVLIKHTDERRESAPFVGISG